LKKLLLISFDAVGDSLVDTLLGYENFASLAAKSTVVRDVQSLFLSNTYPIHGSIATGVEPYRHGIISNTEPFPVAHPRWYTEAARFRAKTLWQAAHEKGLSTAAVLWPVTAGAKEIRWNIPEVMAPPGKSQVAVSLAAGSFWLQLKEYLRHRRLMNGIRQPALDRFSTACMADILREKKPCLALMHLTAYDSLCHAYGADSPEAREGLQTLDECLGILLKAASPDTAVILFSDHSQLPAANQILPNEILVEGGFLKRQGEGYAQGESYVECCGGSGFLHPGPMTTRQIDAFAKAMASIEGFARFLTAEELHICGRQELPLGFAAKPGYAFHAHKSYEIYNHGYPLDVSDYRVFYLLCGDSYQPGVTASGGDLLDITPFAARELQLDMPGIRPLRAMKD
jgi:predicted AlkP superfamily pyrophosphatase or phosphodiesterase